MPDIISARVNLGTLNTYWPSDQVQEPVFEFMQSNEISGLYSGSFTSFVVTPVQKDDIEELLKEYITSHNIDSEGERKIRLWIDALPDALVITERK